MKFKLIALTTLTVVSLFSLNAAPIKAQINQFPALAGIELTEQQKSQITQLRQQTRTQVENILTAQQREDLKTSLGQKQDLESAVKSLNLTFQQRVQIRQIFQGVRQELNSILTPKQQQQLRRNIRATRQNR
ncbi:Spy/CpxP family protein refolding chaperone [Floridanema evergladense]|uniref:Spy/CpxP family protein refolding chaperone n=1 Tax=Floridaenema evergladense BLCC-F167 TaxID=3153639 RepID=A0ABV4WT07_9CYAN